MSQWETELFPSVHQQVQIFNPAFFKYVHDHWTKHHGRYPSTGILVLFFALHVCDEVSVFLLLSTSSSHTVNINIIQKLFTHPNHHCPLGECVWFWCGQPWKLAPLLGAKPLLRRIQKDWCP